MQSPNDNALTLDRLFREIISSTPYDGAILSGGIDSSLMAYYAAQLRPLKVITMALEGTEAPDRAYSRLVAERLGAVHILVEYTYEDAMRAARQVIRIMKYFDHVAVRNDITSYLALERAEEEGITAVITGDGGDELFAGYGYMTRMAPLELDAYISRLTGVWRFSSKQIGEALGLNVVQPFLDNRIVDFAKRLPFKYRISNLDGKIYGKWILRVILNSIGLSEIAMRAKDPIDVGSGSAVLGSYFLKHIGDEADEIVECARAEGVRFWDPEAAYFYKIFREEVGIVPTPALGEHACPCCGAGIQPGRISCGICGHSGGA